MIDFRVNLIVDSYPLGFFVHTLVDMIFVYSAVLSISADADIAVIGNGASGYQARITLASRPH